MHGCCQAFKITAERVYIGPGMETHPQHRLPGWQGLSSALQMLVLHLVPLSSVHVVVWVGCWYLLLEPESTVHRLVFGLGH